MRRRNQSRYEGGPPTARLVVAFVLGLLTGPGTSHATVTVRELWAPNGEVRAVTQANNTLYLGGNFSRVGPVSGPAVAVDLGTAVAQTPFPNVAGKVNCVEPDGSGGWYIAGLFTAVQGQRRANVAHIDAAGQVTPWNPLVDGEILDIAVGANVVYVVGVFLAVGPMWGGGGVQRYGAAAIHATTGLPTFWDPDPSGFPSEVEVGGGKVYLAGSFTTVHFSTTNQPRPGLAEFTDVDPGNPGTGALTPLFAGSNPSLLTISALELEGGKLFYASTYTSSNDVRIYDLTTGLFLPYSVTVGGPVYDIALNQANGTFFLGGSFASIGAQARTNLAALDLATGALVPSWNVGADAPARTLTVGASGLLVGGDFSALGGVPRRGVGLVDPVSAAVLSWDLGCGGNVYSVEADGAKAYVGGEFTIINSVPRTNLAALDETSGALLAWAPTTNATVEALMVSGSTVYIGGQFSNVNGTVRNRAAAVDAVTGALTGFNPNVNGFGPTTVKTFAISGGTVYMGGVFETVRLVDRVGIVAVSATTGSLLTWNPFANGAVYSITYLPGGIFGGPILIVGGDFTAIGGQFQAYVSILDPATAAAGYLDSPNGPVHSMFVEPLPPGYGGYSEILLGGPFTSIAGQPRSHIGMLAAFGLVTSWNPNANADVSSIAKVGNTRFVGGVFALIGGSPRRGIAAIDVNGVATSWDPAALGPYPAGVVYSLLESAGTIYAGGTFTSIADTPHGYFAGMGQIVTAVENDPAHGVTPVALRASPNPFEQSTKIQFSLPREGETQVTVYDVAGRRVREVHKGWLPYGRHTMTWDGREETGRPVAAGVYFIGVRTPAGSLGSKVYRLK
jgi:hypothetical protein